ASPSFPPSQHTGTSPAYTSAQPTGASPSFPPSQHTGASPSFPPSQHTGASPTYSPSRSVSPVHQPDPTTVAPLDRDAWKKAVEQALAQRIEQRTREQGPPPPAPPPTAANTQSTTPENRTAGHLRLPTPANPNRSGETDEFSPKSTSSRTSPPPSTQQTQQTLPPPPTSRPTRTPSAAQPQTRSALHPPTSPPSTKVHRPEATEQIHITKLRQELRDGLLSPQETGVLEEVLDEDDGALSSPPTENSLPLLFSTSPRPSPLHQPAQTTETTRPSPLHQPAQTTETTRPSPLHQPAQTTETTRPSPLHQPAQTTETTRPSPLHQPAQTTETTRPSQAPPKPSPSQTSHSTQQKAHQPEESTDPSIQIQLPWEQIEADALDASLPPPTLQPQTPLSERSGLHEPSDAYEKLLEEAQFIDEYEQPTQLNRVSPSHTTTPLPFAPIDPSKPHPFAPSERGQSHPHPHTFEEEDLDSPTHHHEDALDLSEDNGSKPIAVPDEFDLSAVPDEFDLSAVPDEFDLSAVPDEFDLSAENTNTADHQEEQEKHADLDSVGTYSDDLAEDLATREIRRPLLPSTSPMHRSASSDPAHQDAQHAADLDLPTHPHDPDDPDDPASYLDPEDQYMDPDDGDDLLSLHRLEDDPALPEENTSGLDLHTLHSLMLDPHRDPSQALWAFFDGTHELEELGAPPEESSAPKRKKHANTYTPTASSYTTAPLSSATTTPPTDPEDAILQEIHPHDIPLVPSSGRDTTGPITHNSLEDVANYSALQLWVQLDVEIPRRGLSLPLSQQWMLLSDLSEQLADRIREHGLSLDEQRPDRLHAHSRQGLPCLLRTLQAARTIQDVVYAHPPLAQDARARARCVLTLLTDDTSENESRDTAQRLFQHAPVGQIWLDWSAQLLLKEHESLHEIALPDLEEPAYQLAWEPQTTAQTTDEKGDAKLPFLGRLDILRSLEQAWVHTQHGNVQIVSLVGQSGSGRSRILQQWRNLQQPTLLFWGRAEDCPQERSPSPYLQSLLQSHLHHLHLDGPQALYQSIATHAQGDPHWQAWTSLLFELWNPEASRDRQIEDAMRWYIHLCAQRAPVALLLDDLFLLDLRSQRFLDALLRDPPPRLFVLIAAAPGEFDSLSLSLRHSPTTLEVPPFTPEESRALLRNASLDSPLSPRQQEQLLLESEGNPRILLSLLQSVQRQFDQRETLSDNLRIPQTVEGILLKHLQGLSSIAQDTLRKAAMIGDIFWQGAIESLERMNLAEGSWGLQEGIAIAQLDDRSHVLLELVDKKLIQKQLQSSLPGETEFRFHQKLLRQMMLQQIPLSIRQQMHRRVAEWMQLQDQDGLLIEPIVAHLKQADARNEAARTLFEAAKKQRSLGKKQEALRLMGEALEELSTPQRATRLLWLDTMLRTALQLGDIHATAHLSQLALQLSWRFNNIRWAAQAYLHLGICARMLYQTNPARDHLLNAQALAERQHDDVLRIESWLQLALLALDDGQRDEAHRCMQAVDVILESPPPFPPPTSPHFVRSHLARIDGRWADADRHLQSARSDARRESSGYLYARNLLKEAELYLLAADDEAALRLLGEPTETFRRQECLLDLTQALLLASQALLQQRKTQQAHERLLEAWQATQITAFDVHIGQVAAALAASHTLQNQADASIHFAHITEQKLRTGSPAERALMYFFLGEACAGLPKNRRNELLSRLPQRLPEGGLSTFLFLKSVELFQKAKDTPRHCNALLSLGRALLNDGHLDIAYNVLERGSREAHDAGLSLLSKRFENQKRLLSDDVPPPPDLHRPSSATLVVRVDRLKPTSVPPIPELPQHLQKKKPS
ncbi:AAA family ATPase, partial [Myxococcota bacterium]|nr:AAA family ATPase [Myxococcota bacterium]